MGKQHQGQQHPDAATARQGTIDGAAPPFVSVFELWRRRTALEEDPRRVQLTAEAAEAAQRSQAAQEKLAQHDKIHADERRSVEQQIIAKIDANDNRPFPPLGRYLSGVSGGTPGEKPYAGPQYNVLTVRTGAKRLEPWPRPVKKKDPKPPKQGAEY